MSNALPDPNTAYNHLFDQVHSRIFFNKLAQAGIVPETEKAAHDLLTMAGQLREVAEQEKMAESNYSPFEGPLANLNKALGVATPSWNGQMKQASAREFDYAVKQSADQAAQDPMIYNSVLSLIAAEAQQTFAA